VQKGYTPYLGQLLDRKSNASKTDQIGQNPCITASDRVPKS